MKALSDTRPHDGVKPGRPEVLDGKLLKATLALAEQDQTTRLKGIEALGSINDPRALTTALHAFQASKTGPENLAAQRAVVQLCGRFPERVADAAITLVELISGRVKDGDLILTSDEFSQSCKTVEAVLRNASLNHDVQNRIDATIGSWYERIKEDFRVAPSDMTLTDPRQLAEFLNNSMPEDDRKRISALLSMAMLAGLMEGIRTPKATVIKRELLSEIKPDGFGEYALRPLSSKHAPELHDAVEQVLVRWGRSVSPPFNRFVMACAAFTDLFRNHSGR